MERGPKERTGGVAGFGKPTSPQNTNSFMLILSMKCIGGEFLTRPVGHGRRTPPYDHRDERAVHPSDDAWLALRSWRLTNQRRRRHDGTTSSTGARAHTG